LFPEISGVVPSVTKAVLAIVPERALAAPWAEGLSVDFMVVVLEAEALLEVVAQATGLDRK